MEGDDLRESVGLARDGTTKDEVEVGSAEEVWDNDRYKFLGITAVQKVSGHRYAGA